MKSGFVYIVGAGPGDPDLITVKGRRCVRHADVILHDRLIHPGVLAEARPKAIVIDAGKRFGHEDQQQAEIHSLMIKYAREGNEVCRLKGGDPFIFGRGGEEVAILKAAQVPFEVIPGVSSFTAAPAAAGIPLTHRDYTHGFLVITGSKSAGLMSTPSIVVPSLLCHEITSRVPSVNAFVCSLTLVNLRGAKLRASDTNTSLTLVGEATVKARFFRSVRRANVRSWPRAWNQSRRSRVRVRAPRPARSSASIELTSPNARAAARRASSGDIPASMNSCVRISR